MVRCGKSFSGRMNHPVSMVGKNVDCLCSRCKLVLAHVVLYEVAGDVQGVKCKTCGAEHRYRGPRPQRRREVPAERSPRGLLRGQPAFPSSAPGPTGGRAALGDADGRSRTGCGGLAVSNSPRIMSRGTGSPILASAGVSSEVVADGMEVLFQEGRKLLAINRPAPDPAG